MLGMFDLYNVTVWLFFSHRIARACRNHQFVNVDLNTCPTFLSCTETYSHTQEEAVVLSTLLVEDGSRFFSHKQDVIILVMHLMFFFAYKSSDCEKLSTYTVEPTAQTSDSPAAQGY